LGCKSACICNGSRGCFWMDGWMAFWGFSNPTTTQVLQNLLRPTSSKAVAVHTGQGIQGNPRPPGPLGPPPPAAHHPLFQLGPPWRPCPAAAPCRAHGLSKPQRTVVCSHPAHACQGSACTGPSTRAVRSVEGGKGCSRQYPAVRRQGHPRMLLEKGNAQRGKL
jgi:hypothetical protein